ncbi:polysaccharide biosynthesis protein [Exiguobacterium antarcticum]|uniref:Polysaccharide biosynthesis protein n=1 Tax=Exiguobacterium antarcticum TaxID=132920 RepID=A0ABT6QY08_9BACL|nr:polysaccharide biosynthesis protein [Exiguobacterium antarcticum]AFS71221.1 Polysaccharide biosynthesis protein [Exiguobacterium antarcticum B7]MDI3233433.1 polysaccharide biosynthesis protein [Exiguobacterium antarcticum]
MSTVSKKQETSSTNTGFVRGTMLLSGASLISRALGLIYLFPFQFMVGATGIMFYTYAYNYYAIMIGLATAGIPVAVSKFVAKYNAMGEYDTSERLYRSGLKIMSITGVLSFLALFLLAPYLAHRAIPGGDVNSASYIDAVTMTIRGVSFALILIPAMSMTRGYFQGYQSMGPTAISQILEQIVRIIFLLAGVSIAIYLFDSDAAWAATIATFSAFIGAIGSVVVLVYYFRKRAPGLKALREGQTVVSPDRPLSGLYKELLTYAIPIVMVGLSTPLYQVIDQNTMNAALQSIGYTLEAAGNATAYLIADSHKIVLIPVSVATGLSLAATPLLTASFTQGDMRKVRKQISQIYQLAFFVTIPAVVGMILLSEETFRVLFPKDQAAWVYLLSYAPSALFLALYSVTAAVLQGINRQYFTIVATIAGLLTKYLLNAPLIHWVGDGTGAGYATILGYLVATGLMFFRITQTVQFPFSTVLRRTSLIMIISAIMGASVALVKWGLDTWLPDTIVGSLVILLVGAGVGIVVFAGLSIWSGLAEAVLGRKFSMKRGRGNASR